MKAIKLLLILLLVHAGVNAQFTLLDNTVTNTVIKNSNADAYLFSFKPDELIKFKFENNALQSESLNIPQNSATQEVNDLRVITKDVLYLRIAELQNNHTSNFYYLSIDGSKTWNKITTPDKKLPVFSYADEVKGIIYFSKSDLTGYYTYEYATNRWDFINFQSTPFDIIKMKGGIGYLQLFTTGGDRIAYTTDGGKTYVIQNQINYTSAPFSSANQGILQKVTMVTDQHWYAQYQFVEAGSQKNQVLVTTDQGATWKVIMNTFVDLIQPASDNTVYIYKQDGAKGLLYLVSDYGNKVCPTLFTGRVQSMNFMNPSSGIIFAQSPETLTYGVWLLTNSGGAVCGAANGIASKSKTSTKNNISVYPNPASSQITISHPSATRQAAYSIQSVTGQVVMTGELQEGTTNTEINISGLSAGVYMIRTDSGVSKFVKE